MKTKCIFSFILVYLVSFLISCTPEPPIVDNRAANPKRDASIDSGIYIPPKDSGVIHDSGVNAQDTGVKDTITCNGKQINPMTDTEHCGGCNKPCTPPPNTKPTCENAHCTYSCINNLPDKWSGSYDAYLDCDGKLENGCEVQLSSSICGCGTPPAYYDCQTEGLDSLCYFDPTLPNGGAWRCS